MTSENAATRRIVGTVRAIANTALAIGAIVLLIAFATHWPPEAIAPIGLLTIVSFLTSFIAIIIENRLPEGPPVPAGRSGGNPRNADRPGAGDRSEDTP